jgi:hypothetical protein
MLSAAMLNDCGCAAYFDIEQAAFAALRRARGTTRSIFIAARFF